MHIGLIVGIGPAATDYYYRYLIAALQRAGQDLHVTMAHADTGTLLRNQAAGNIAEQVDVYQALADQMVRAGIEQIAVTSIAGHFCIDAFKAVCPVPVIDLLDVVTAEVARRGFKKVGLLGTRVVMQTGFYGVLRGVKVVAPQNLDEVHDAYVAMASAGRATTEQRDVFMAAGRALAQEHGCESVLLAGTDLALVFNPETDAGFSTLDCAQVHATAIASAAMAASRAP